MYLNDLGSTLHNASNQEISLIEKYASVKENDVNKRSAGEAEVASSTVNYGAFEYYINLLTLYNSYAIRRDKFNFCARSSLST